MAPVRLLFGLIVTVARAWGLWALAMHIPASGFQDGVLGTDSSFALAQFAALRLAVELALLLVVFNLSTAIWAHLTGRTALSDWSVNGFGAKNVNQLRKWAATVLILCAGWIWLSRHQLLWTANDVLAGWLQPFNTAISQSLSCLCLLGAAYLVGSSYGLSVMTEKSVRSVWLSAHLGKHDSFDQLAVASTPRIDCKHPTSKKQTIHPACFSVGQDCQKYKKSSPGDQ